MTIGERIKQRRTQLELSQEDLAKRLGYKSRSSINKIELSRNLPITKVEDMAKALSCTPAYLMGWADLDGNPINQPTMTSKLAPLIANNDSAFDRLIDLYLSIPSDKRVNFVDYLTQSANLFRS